MANVKWIKISTNIFNDEAIELIEQMPEGDAILIIWFKLLVNAGRVNNGGLIYFKENIPYTDEMLSVIFKKPVAIIRLALRTFEQFGLIKITNENEILITNWEKYQNIEGLDKIRLQTRERVSRFRKKQKLIADNKECNVTSPLQVTQCNGIDIDKEIDIEEDKEKNKKDIFCNVDFQKCFNLYEKNCKNLIPIGFAKRNKETLKLLSDFLEEIEYDFDYFEILCSKANDLKFIVDTKIDFKMMIKNHDGIINGKYIKNQRNNDLSGFNYE